MAAGGDTDAAFESAEVIVKDTIIQQRLIPNAMEPRSAVASYLPAMGELTLWNTTQNPHIARFVICLVTGLGNTRSGLLHLRWEAGSAQRSRCTPQI